MQRFYPYLFLGIAILLIALAVVVTGWLILFGAVIGGALYLFTLLKRYLSGGNKSGHLSNPNIKQYTQKEQQKDQGHGRIYDADK